MAFSREVRVGLVMYGGVSLAIYINGVAREFFEAVRGRRVYALLKHLTDSDIVVDIVSGASAGGINGVFLCQALANDYDFSRLAALWREHADIDRLLRPLSASAPESLFDSEAYYQPRLEEAFAEMEPVEREASEEPSPVEALDLFVMGTDYHGARAFRPDALGSLLESKNHRTVFRLKHRKNRPGGDFDGGDERGGRAEHDRALATLCRLTSAFPAAFTPTRVPAPDPRDPDGWAAKLQRWGGLERETYFIDGGVLDNKPFTDVIEQIYFRTTVRPVDRVLFYVEPDPERFTRITQPEAPDIVGVIANSLVGIPRYESIARDLAAIDQRNARLREYAILAEGVIEAALAAEMASSLAEPAEPPASSPYWNLRLRELCESFAAAAGADERPAAELDEARRLIDGICAPDRAMADKRALLDRYDVEFSLRRIFLVIYRLYGDLFGRDGGPVVGDRDVDLRRGKQLLHALNRHLQLLKLIQSVLRAFQRETTGDAVDRGRAAAHAIGLRASLSPEAAARATSAAVAGAIEARLWPIFAGAPVDHALAARPGGPDASWDDYLPDEAIEEIKRALAARCAAGAEAVAGPPEEGLLAAVDRATAAVLALFAGGSAAAARAAALWRCFASIDGSLFPLERLSGLREKDPIETVRISPADARLGYSRRQAADKVAGDSLGHFGGFLKRSWRSNDILWGRLDARCLLVQQLLQRDRIARVAAAPEQRDRIRASLDRLAAGAASPVAALFPGAAAADQAAIAAWLDDLLGDDDARRAGALARIDRAPDRDGAIAPLLVRASQDGVLAEDLAAGRDPDAPGPAPKLETQPERARFFRESYAVGKETWLRDVATRGLLRTATHTGLIARDAVFSSVGRRSAVRSRLLAPIRRVLGMPLWLGYWFATATRFRSPRIAAVVASALLLFIATQWTAVLRPPGAAVGADMSSVWVAFFVLAPIAWLGLEALIFCVRAGRWASAALAVAIAGLAALVLSGKVELQLPVTWGRPPAAARTAPPTTTPAPAPPAATAEDGSALAARGVDPPAPTGP